MPECPAARLSSALAIKEALQVEVEPDVPAGNLRAGLGAGRVQEADPLALHVPPIDQAVVRPAQPFAQDSEALVGDPMAHSLSVVPKLVEVDLALGLPESLG